MEKKVCKFVRVGVEYLKTRDDFYPEAIYIIKDTESGILYLCNYDGHIISMTPWLKSDGSPHTDEI